MPRGEDFPLLAGLGINADKRQAPKAQAGALQGAVSPLHACAPRLNSHMESLMSDQGRVHTAGFLLQRPFVWSFKPTRFPHNSFALRPLLLCQKGLKQDQGVQEMDGADTYALSSRKRLKIQFLLICKNHNSRESLESCRKSKLPIKPESVAVTERPC